MIRRRRTIAAAFAASALLIAACGGDDEETTTTEGSTETTEASTDTTAAATDTTEASTDTTEAAAETTAPETTEPAADAWAVDTEDCIDPDAANAPIEGTVKIGSAMPLTGGVAAAAWAPIEKGLGAYINYANEMGLLPGYTIELQVEDDQYNPELTPGAVNTLLDSDVDLITGIIGSPNNAAVRDLLNDECIPQLNALTGSPRWGEVNEYPWTTGLLVPYTVESKVYAAHIAEQFPDGATVGLFFTNNEFGQIYADAFKEMASEYGLKIVEEQTIEATDANPPTSQVTTLAAATPDVVMAVPLGAGCISFLSELANGKAQSDGWEPLTYITNTCASSLILGAAGAAADGLFTSGNLVDLGDPANDEIPEVAEYKAFLESEGLSDIVTTAATGWTAGEVTVAILKQAAESPQGLTRASIINAARSLEYVPSLARQGVVGKTRGAEDPYFAESLIVIQYDAQTATFSDIGELITEFES